MGVLSLWTGKHTSQAILAGITDNLLMMQVHRTEGYSLHILWTLHAEIWFYVLAPLILFPLRQQRQWSRLIQTTLLIAGASVAFLVRDRYITIPHFPLSELTHHFDCFAVGILLAIWRKEIYSFPSSLANRIIFSSAFVGIILSYLIRSKGTWFQSEIQLTVACLCCIIIACALRENIRLDNPLAKWIGLTSYSMYLVHGVILDFRLIIPLRNFAAEMGVYQLIGVSARLDRLANSTSLFICALLIGTVVMHFMLERPGMWAGRVLSRKPTV